MLQQKMKEILQKEDDLQEIVQSLGNRQSSKRDAFILAIVEMIMVAGPNLLTDSGG